LNLDFLFEFFLKRGCKAVKPFYICTPENDICVVREKDRKKFFNILEEAKRR
tara:strand:- start:87 stop:242 length:156 start_codon:yes stop_codon:yes gene_type:complete